MVQEIDYTKFVQSHEAQLVAAGVPHHFWQTLYIKLKNLVFDSNNSFTLLQIDYGDETRKPEDPLWVLQVKNPDGIKFADKKHIYLVDHAWTFRMNDAKQIMSSMWHLQARMEKIMGTSNPEAICDLMWKYCQTYSVSNASKIEDRLPIWFIMDELGNGIQHSDDPNFQAVPFVYAAEQISYTIIFPVRDLEFGETVTRDFIAGVTDLNDREALLIPWLPTDLSDIDFSQTEPSETYFLSGHIEESLPINLDFKFITPDRIKVFSEYSLVNMFLTVPQFEIVDDESSADVLWLTRHFKAYAELSQVNKFVNQFPFENVLTIKDLLSIICRRNTINKADPITLETNPKWLPTTYNLKTELPKFVSYFQNRAARGFDNHWICKPWNLARSLDTHITSNLDYILRLPSTGPKIAQKYLHNPILFDRPEVGKVKFDIRYVILLKSVAPLKAYIYNNFFLRFANKPFVLLNFEDYETHFTVMNYNKDADLKHLPCADFLVEWNQQYPNYPWADIQVEIVKMFREVLEAASVVEPPKGIAPSPQSRAVYAADVMLSWETNEIGDSYMQPKLLEINWTPDCQRACDYYPDFYNDIFECLFLNKERSIFTCL